MAVEFTPKVYDKLSGGLNTSSANVYLQDGEFRALTNFQTDTDGSVSMRQGYVDVGVAETTHLAGTGLFQYRPFTGASQLLKTCKNTGAFSDAALKRRNSSTWTPIAETAFTLLDHSFCDFLQYQNAVYIVAHGGNNRVMKYDGVASFTEVAGSPKAQVFTQFLDRIWAAKDPAAPSVLYYTATAAPDNWTTSDAGSISVAVNDGDQIMGVVALFNRLIIFKRYSIYVMDGNDFGSYTIQKVVSDGGAVSSRSIVSIENRVIYLSDKGWYETDGSTTKFVSDKIRPTRLDSLNRARDDQSFSFHHRKRSQYVAVASGVGSSVNNVALPYKYDSNIGSVDSAGGSGWSNFTAFNFNAGCVIQNAGNDQDIYFLGNTDGKLYIYERNEAGVLVSTDDGAGYPLDIRTKWMDHGAPNYSKIWRRITLAIQALTNGVSSSYVYRVNLGVPVSAYLQMEVQKGSGTGFVVSLFTDVDGKFEETTPQQIITLTPATGVVFTGIQKFTVEAQILPTRVILAS